MNGKVTLVGAGPGGKELLTLKGADAIKNADAVVFDRLVGEDILELIDDNAQKIDVGKESSRHPVPQNKINEILVELASEGKNTVRLKGGDCFLFGRGGEECEYLKENNIPFEVVPGVTSALAAPAYCGIPVTHRDYCSSVHIVTAHAGEGKKLDIDYESLIKLNGTLVFLMGLASLGQIMDGLKNAGMSPDTPAAVIENGARPVQRKIVSTVGRLANEAVKAGFKSPSLTVVGKVCGLSGKLDWFATLPLYGKTIAVTRPKERKGALSDMLRKLGANVIECPCIEIREKEGLGPLKTALGNRYDWVVFTSPAGVNAAAHALPKLGLDMRALYNMKFASIGKGTQTALSAYGITADLVPAHYDSENLAKELALRLPQGGSVLLLRAQKGGSMLPEELRRANIKVADVPLYDTIYHCEKADKLRKLIDSRKLDYVTFTSASTVHGFAGALGNADFSHFTGICIGAQTEQAAEKYNIKTLTAENATLNDLVSCIIKHSENCVL